MSKILRRPMFRGGGTVSSYGNGIASGLADGGRVNLQAGGAPQRTSQNPYKLSDPVYASGYSAYEPNYESGALTGADVKKMAEEKVFGSMLGKDTVQLNQTMKDFMYNYLGAPLDKFTKSATDYAIGTEFNEEGDPIFGNQDTMKKIYDRDVMPEATKLSNELITQEDSDDTYEEEFLDKETYFDEDGKLQFRDTNEVDLRNKARLKSYVDNAPSTDREDYRSSQYDDGSLKALLTRQRLAEEEANRVKGGGQDASESDFEIPVGVVEEEPEKVVEEMGFKEMADAYYEMMGGGAEERMDARIAATEGREDDRIRRARGSDISNTLLKFFEGSQEGGATVGSSAANASRFLTSKPSETELAKRSKETKMDKLDDASFNRDEARRNKATDMAYKEYMQDKGMKFSDVKDQKSFDRKMEMLKMQLDNATGIAEKQIIANRIRDLEKFDFAKNQKEGTKGALQKDIETLRGLVGTDRSLALVKLGNPPDLTSALNELKVYGTISPSTIKSYVGLYYGSEYKGIIGGDESPTLPGVYLDKSMTKLMTVDANGNKSVEVLPTN